MRRPFFLRAVGFLQTCTRVAASSVVGTDSPGWAKRLTMSASVSEILVRHAEERAKAEAKAAAIRLAASKGTKKQKVAANAKAQKLVDDLRYLQEDELEVLGVDPDGEEVEDLLSALVAKIDANEAEATKAKEAARQKDSAATPCHPHTVIAEAAVPAGGEACQEGGAKNNRDAGIGGTESAVPAATVKTKSKKSKAQRRREAAEELKKRQREEAEREAAEMAGKTPKELEDKAMNEILAGVGMKIHSIIADGNCLFRSIQHQLELLDGEALGASKTSPRNHMEVRQLCANTLREHPDEYLPFVESENPMTLESFNKYCETLENTSEWGGELEVQAISRALKVEIHVFQTTSPPITFGKGNANGLLRLSYHQHHYHLGAHYNSIVAGDYSVS